MRTPSSGIDFNKDNIEVSKYWGRVPIYTHIIWETVNTDNPIVECNKEYEWLVDEYMLGSIDKNNLSIELYNQIEDTVNSIPDYGRIPMPKLDPFFECMFGPKDPLDQCALLVDKDCHPIVDSNGCYLSPPQENIWDDFLYYCDSDPSSYGIYVWNIKDMRLDAHIKTTLDNPHSVDRACLTDKMYCRTQNGHAFEVFDARTQEMVKTVPLLHKPRTTGDPNLFLNLQLISGKDHPMISVIDVDDDTVIYTAGVYKQPGQTITGNQGGSATGHPSWLDAHHFTLLDRYNDRIDVYRVTETGDTSNKFSFKKVQELVLPTAVHTMDPDKISFELVDKTFYMVIEGSHDLGISPGMWKVTWIDQVLALDVSVTLPVPDDDACHHFGFDRSNNEIYLPTFKSGRMFILDADTLVIKRENVCGAGGGHVNFSYLHNVACVTNHFDNDTTIVEMTTGQVWNIQIANESPIPYPGLIQSHTNHISEDEEFFYIGSGANGHGKLTRVNLGNVISGTGSEINFVNVGGHPEQSTS